jgi:hypothetical protein
MSEHYSDIKSIPVGKDEVLFGQGHSPFIEKNLINTPEKKVRLDHAIRYLLAPGNSETEVRVTLSTPDGDVEAPAYRLFVLKKDELSQLAAESIESLWHVLDVVNQELSQTIQIAGKLKSVDKAIQLDNIDMAARMIEDIERRYPRVTQELLILEALLIDIRELLETRYFPEMNEEFLHLNAEFERVAALPDDEVKENTLKTLHIQQENLDVFVERFLDRLVTMEDILSKFVSGRKAIQKQLPELKKIVLSKR